MKDSAVRRWSTFHRLLYRLTGGRVGSRLVDNEILLLTTTGNRTGREHSVPLLFLRDDERLVLIASYGGRPGHPTWYRNLVEHPEVRVQVGRVRRQMIARTATPAERQVWWPRIVAAYEGYDEYQSRTDREIPVVFLDPAEDG